MEEAIRFYLCSNKVIVGTLLVLVPRESTDLKWECGRFIGNSAFEGLQHGFEESQELLRQSDYKKWIDYWEAFSRDLTLRQPDGKEVTKFILHIRRDRAEWTFPDDL